MEEMNMKKIYISILAVAAMTLAACNKEQHIDEPVQDVVENNYPVLKAVIDPETKMALDGTQLSFEVGDVISVFNGIVDETNHHGHCKYKCTSVEDDIAVFEWITYDKDADNKYTPSSTVETIVASYPNRSTATAEFEPEEEGYGEGTVKIRMVAGPNGTDSFLPASLPIIAYAQQGEMLRFKHTCGLLKLTVKGTAKIAQVKIESDKIISGNASVPYASEKPLMTVLGTGDPNKDYMLTYTYTSKKTVGEETVTVGGVQLEEKGTDMYFGLPEGTHNLVFTFKDMDGNIMKVGTNNSLVIKRAEITPSALTFAADPAINLSPNKQYANCYVVQSAGTYMFDAKKPNGKAVTGTSATWVWAAGDQFKPDNGVAPITVMITDVKLENGKVVFSIPSSVKYGNVVLGVVNADNEIQYTWNIWVTSKLEDVYAEGIVVMDRNLGASYKFDVTTGTNATSTFGGRGSFYQWGRKDPVLGARNATSETAAEAFTSTSSQYNILNTSLVNVRKWESGVEVGVSQENGSKYPVSLAKSKQTPGYISGDTGTVWSDRENANPCPYGYRVINQDEMVRLVTSSIVPQEPNADVSVNSGQALLAGKVIIPRVAFRYGSDGKLADAKVNKARSVYWLNNPSQNDGYATAYSFWWTSNAEMDMTKTLVYDWTAYNCGAVRCVRVAK